MSKLLESLFDKSTVLKYQEDAKTRLKSYCMRYCLIGLENLRSKNDIKLMMSYGKLESDEERERLMNLYGTQLDCGYDHIICKECAKKINEGRKNNPNKDNFGGGVIKLNCNVCSEVHTIPDKVWFGLCKNKDGGCCSIF